MVPQDLLLSGDGGALSVEPAYEVVKVLEQPIAHDQVMGELESEWLHGVV